MKPIEEKAREYALEMAACYMTDNQALPDDQTINDFTMTFLAGAEEATRWIPVEEGLIPVHKDFLIQFQDGTIRRFNEDWEFRNSSVTHWRPIE